MAEMTPCGYRFMDSIFEPPYQSWSLESDRFGTRFGPSIEELQAQTPRALERIAGQIAALKTILDPIALGDEMPEIHDQHTAEAAAKFERARSSVLAAEARLVSARQSEAAALEALEAAKRAPAEPDAALGRPTVVTFSKTFGRAYGQVYDYAAVRPASGNRWALTGRDTRTNITWAQLVAFMRQDEGNCANLVLNSLVVATSFESVTN